MTVRLRSVGRLAAAFLLLATCETGTSESTSTWKSQAMQGKGRAVGDFTSVEKQTENWRSWS